MADKPTHYKIVSHSMYTRDLDELNRKIGLLKQHGWSRANRSHLIRIALARLSDDELVAIASEQRRRSTQINVADLPENDPAKISALMQAMRATEVK